MASSTSSAQTVKLSACLAQSSPERVCPRRRALCDQHAADPRGVVARVVGAPLAVEVGLEPGVKVHRRGAIGDGDVRQVDRKQARGGCSWRGRKSRRYARNRGRRRRAPGRHRSLRSSRCCSHSHRRCSGVPNRRSPGRAPSRQEYLAKHLPGSADHQVGRAVAARQRVHQHLVGQRIDQRALQIDEQRVGLRRHGGDGVVAQNHPPLWRGPAPTGCRSYRRIPRSAHLAI